MRTVRARASWGLTGITMIDYAAVVSYLRQRPRRKDRPVCGAKTKVSAKMRRELRSEYRQAAGVSALREEISRASPSLADISP
jgi:hypothetical protein